MIVWLYIFNVNQVILVLFFSLNKIYYFAIQAIQGYLFELIIWIIIYEN